MQNTHTQPDSSASMASSNEVCLSPVCLGGATSGLRVPGAGHLDQRQDHSDRRHPHRWQAWYPGWVRARFTAPHATRHVLSSAGTPSLCFCCRCGVQSVLGACPVHCLPQQAPAAEPVPETPSVLGRRLEGTAAEQAPVKPHDLCFEG